MFSVFHDGKTLAVMKPMAQLRGWWVLQGRGVEWVNPMARDISAVRAQAGKGEWPLDANSSMYNANSAFMLVKGKRAALAEMRGLADQVRGLPHPAA